MKAHSIWDHQVWTVGRLNRIESQPKSIFSLSFAMLCNKKPIKGNIYQKLISIWIMHINSKANRHFWTAHSLNLCFCSFIIWSLTVSESEPIHNSQFFESLLCLSRFIWLFRRNRKFIEFISHFISAIGSPNFIGTQKRSKRRRLLSIEIYII